MKKIVLLLLVTLSLTSFTRPEDTSFNIVGRWKGVQNKSVGYLVFQEDGYAFLEEKNGKKIGGKNFIENGKKATMTYKFQDMGKLMHIDIIVTIVGEKNTNSLIGIAQKINNDSFKLQFGFDNVRPKTFNKKETVVFNRVK